MLNRVILTVAILAVFGGCAWAWMGDRPTAGVQPSGMSAAVAAPLKSYSIVPLGGHSL